jgi:hypothetical protein
MTPDPKLYYGALPVGTLRDVFESDGTWYGTLDLDSGIGSKGQEDELSRRIAEYIRFAEEWNERAHRVEPADASEFDQYSDLVKSRQWSTRDENGEVNQIADAPVFFTGGEVSWQIN